MFLPTTKLILAYVLTLGSFLVIDLLWLGFVGRGLYKRYVPQLLEGVNWPAAFVFYALFIVGIFIFAIAPAIESEGFKKALMLGALFGFFTYATYDLTNLATVKDWPIQITIIDIIWGAVLTATTAGIGFQIVQWLR